MGEDLLRESMEELEMEKAHVDVLAKALFGGEPSDDDVRPRKPSDDDDDDANLLVVEMNPMHPGATTPRRPNATADHARVDATADAMALADARGGERR